MDGPAALAVLRGQPRTAAIPVVAVTSSAMMGDRERLLAAGFDGYLEKPIQVKEFAAQVRAYCRHAERGDR
jgi:CheY-like chemotaxis protein